MPKLIMQLVSREDFAVCRTLGVYSFCKDKPGYPMDKWLNNRHGNGYSIQSKGNYTTFILEF